jgi:DNA-binding response OmpR family regulator
LATNDSDNGGLRRLSRETGSPAVDLGSVTLQLAILQHVSEDVARRLQVLPLRVDRGHLFVAVSNPNDVASLDEISFLSGKKVVAYAAPSHLLGEAIEEAYSAKRRGELEWRGSRVRTGDAAMSLRDLMEPVAVGTSDNVPTPIKETGSAGVKLQKDMTVTPPAMREPFGTDAGYQGGSISREIPARERPRILVVDDEAVIRRILQQALSQRGLEVIEAPTGMDALQRVKDSEPDAILLDAMLPDIHGFDICKRLKESRRYHHIPVLMMTAVYKGWRMAADLKESYGVVGYIEKPFDIRDVVQRLENALAGRSDEPLPDPAALSEEAQRLYAEGAASFKRGDLDGAIAQLTSAVGIDPLSAVLRQQLGLLFAHRGHDFAAIQELETSVELDPMQFAALRNLAVLYQRRGFRRKACELWERALAIAPDDPTRAEIKNLLVQLL